MQYRMNTKTQEQISILGYGCMRFKKRNGQIDMIEAEKEVMYAIDNGINYFDTAYIYPGNEAALGIILAKNNCRENVMIATKLPQYLLKSKEKLDTYFNEQCRRLQTDYIDYYLMHMLPDIETWEKLKDLGIVEWIEEKKNSGEIKNIGFSYHGNTIHFQELIDAYEWDFCQIQYNYMDEHSQAGRVGLSYAANKKIPVFIMEPLRGGKLINHLPKKALEAFEKTGLPRSPAEWALRWLWNQPEVTCVLSGMNSLAMIEENIRIASEVQIGELTSEDEILFDTVKKEINAKIKVGCTGCAYCMPCPKGVDIPGIFRCYDVRFTDGYVNGFREYVMCTSIRSKKSNASLCIQCGKCEKHCPQQIEIRKQLKNVVKTFETPIYKVAMFAIKKMQK